MSEFDKPANENKDRVLQELRALKQATDDLQRRLGALIDELDGGASAADTQRAELARKVVEQLRMMQRTGQRPRNKLTTRSRASEE